jgi:iron-sulfur cluster assembly accessory protein
MVADTSAMAGSAAVADSTAVADNTAVANTIAMTEVAVPDAMATTEATATAPAHTFTARDGKGIQITEPAMKQLANLMTQQGSGKVLRVGVRSGGCSGMSYTMDFIDSSAIRSDDERYTYEPAEAPSFEVVCDPKSLLYIYGMQLDFSSALIGGGFNFTNPNASQTCGCGSSFAV